MKKVYFVGSMYDGCYFVRCLLPIIHNGWDGDKTSMRGTRNDSTRSFQGALGSDIVVFHRPDDKAKVEAMKLLKEHGQKVVFDNDDTYKSVDAMKFQDKLDERAGYLDEAIKVADLVTTSTEFLADEYRKLNPNVVVLPNCIDPDDWDEPIKNTNGKVRIGIVGSTAINKDCEHIKGLLKELTERDDVEVVLFALPPKTDDYKKMRDIYAPEIKFWDSLKVEWQSFVPQPDYMETLRQLKLDMMLIPREDSYFNRCKSNLKFLEASILEIPVIAQGFKDGKSPYQGTGDSLHMFIADTEDEWRHWVNFLIDNPQEREIMGAEAKEYVLDNYNIHDKWINWQTTYDKMFI